MTAGVTSRCSICGMLVVLFTLQQREGVLYDSTE